MRLTRIILGNNRLHYLYRSRVVPQNQAQIVKLSNSKEDGFLKLSFKYLNSPYLNIKIPKNESLKTVLQRIKLMAGLQIKKEEIRQFVVNKYTSGAESVVESVDEDLDVCLLEDDQLIDESLPNSEAWTRASMLRVGETVYDVKYNLPTVLSLSLPNYIISNCPIRAHYILECGSSRDSIFTWYRSVSKTEAERLISDGKEEDVLIEESKFWFRVRQSFIYHTTDEDVGHFLKVVCTPKCKNVTGVEESADSNSVVEGCPESFPFEDRQLQTASLCDVDSLRCVSYNTLANCYVEKRKYPYCSSKSRDNYYRKQLLLRELVGYNSDIICLQEVPERNFHYDLAPVLSDVDFDGFYLKKGGRRNEGLATFFRKSKYRLVEKYDMLLNNITKDNSFFMNMLSKISGNLKDMSKLLIQDTAFQALLLEQVDKPGRHILTGNTHLYSNKDTPEVRLMQAAICTHHIEHILNLNKRDSIAVLFCGDFNSLPDSTTYKFITSGSHDCSQNIKNGDVNIDHILKNSLSLQSACGTPEYTNYTDEFQGCLDYIFYSTDSLGVAEIVPMPSHEKVVAQVGLPNEYFPSDHIALVCTLRWKNC